MSFNDEGLEPGINPHFYAARKYPGYKYIDNSMEKSFLNKIATKRKYKHVALLKDYAGTWYLFAK